jgi:hypothetical protein
VRLSVHERRFGNMPIVHGGLSGDITRSASVSGADLLKGELDSALELGICEVARTAVTRAIHTCRMTVSFVTLLSLFLQLIVTRITDPNSLSDAEVR